MHDLLSFLNADSGAITAVATVVGVFVAGVYTLYTTRLWKVSDRTLHNAEAQANVSQRQLQLMEEQFKAGQRTFEAVHRPRLLLDAHVEELETSSDHKPFLIVAARNFGTTSATVTSVDCKVPANSKFHWGTRFLPIVIPGIDEDVLGRAFLGESPNTNIPDDENWFERVARWVWVYVEYRELEHAYSAGASILLVPAIKDKTKWTVLSVTPRGPEFWPAHSHATELTVQDDASRLT